MSQRVPGWSRAKGEIVRLVPAMRADPADPKRDEDRGSTPCSDVTVGGWRYDHPASHRADAQPLVPSGNPLTHRDDCLFAAATADHTDSAVRHGAQEVLRVR